VAQLAAYIHHPIILNLLIQFIFYTVEYGGTFHTPKKGISRGSPLSPLLAGFQLYQIDQHFAEQRQLAYIRFMDDFIILCKTRHHLPQALKELNQYFNHLGFQQHPNKTLIGKTNRSFDFLGYKVNQACERESALGSHFNAAGLGGIAASTLQHHHGKATSDSHGREKCSFCRNIKLPLRASPKA